MKLICLYCSRRRKSKRVRQTVLRIAKSRKKSPKKVNTINKRKEKKRLRFSCNTCAKHFKRPEIRDLHQCRQHSDRDKSSADEEDSLARECVGKKKKAQLRKEALLSKWKCGYCSGKFSFSPYFSLYNLHQYSSWKKFEFLLKGAIWILTFQTQKRRIFYSWATVGCTLRKHAKIEYLPREKAKKMEAIRLQSWKMNDY